MIKRSLFIILIFISAIFSGEKIKFIFWNDTVGDQGEPLYANNIEENKVEYKLRINDQDGNFKKLTPKKRRAGKYTDDDGNKYHIYLVEEDFNELLIGNGTMDDCEKNKLYLDFKVTTKNNFYTGSQILVGNLWDCEEMPNQSMSEPDRSTKRRYFPNSNIIDYGGGGKEPIIEIILNSPKLRISGTLIDFKTKDKIDLKSINIRLNSEAEGNLSLTKIPTSKFGSYIVEVQLSPNATDVSSTDYRLYFTTENYYSQFIDIDNDRLHSGKEQIENIKFKPRFPFFNSDITANPNEDILFYNDDCMKWMCKDNPNSSENEQQTQIYIKKIDQCVDRCKPFERSQISNGIHECVFDHEIKDKDFEQESSYQTKIDSCISIKLDNIKNNNFRFLHSSNIGTRDNIEDVCRDEVSKSINIDDQYTIFSNDFLNDYEGDCEFDDYIEENLCDNINKDILEDYYFLIKLSDALYKNIRNAYSDESILNMISDNSNSDFNDIERLILLYNKIDLLSEAGDFDFNKLKFDHAGGDVPSYVYMSLVAEHHMKRIEFYLWYLESLFFWNQKGYYKNGQCKEGAYCHRVYDEESDEIKLVDFSYLCNNYSIDIIDNSYGTRIMSDFEKKLVGKLPTLKNMNNFISFIESNIKSEIKKYRDYGDIASKNENYQFRNVNDIKRKVKNLLKEMN